jgi:ribosomal-protein-alanine N-acetyltransferase
MIRVRPARSQEVPRLMEIASHSPTAARWSQTAYAKLFAPDAPRELVGLVIDEEGQAKGFLVGRSVSPDNHEWEIENVAISGSARRRGLGSHLLGEFIRLVRERGGREIFLEVRESNRAALKLYEKWAFVEAGRRKAYYHDPPEDALILRFSFPAPA